MEQLNTFEKAFVEGMSLALASAENKKQREFYFALTSLFQPTNKHQLGYDTGTSPLAHNLSQLDYNELYEEKIPLAFAFLETLHKVTFYPHGLTVLLDKRIFENVSIVFEADTGVLALEEGTKELATLRLPSDVASYFESLSQEFILSTPSHIISRTGGSYA